MRFFFLGGRVGAEFDPISQGRQAHYFDPKLDLI